MIDWKSIVVVLGMLAGAAMLTSCAETETNEAPEVETEVVVEETVVVKADSIAEVAVLDTTKVNEGKVE